MCPSGGQGGGLCDRLRRVIRNSLNRERQPVTLLLPAAPLLLGAAYCFPLLSALVLCAAGCWAYLSSPGPRWRFPEWRQLGGGAAGRRQRPALQRRHREPAFKWSPTSLLLLMGSYLGKEEPPARVVGRGARELKDRLSRPNPTVPTPARRLSFRETPVMPIRTFMSPRRRYPTHQPQYSMPGSLPMVYLDGYQRKSLLSPKASLVRSPVTVKIAPPDPNISRSPVLNNLLSRGPASPSVQPAPDPCAKETVLNAIRESRKRLNKDEYNGSGSLDNKRRRQTSSGNVESSFECPVANGALSPYVSKPDNLKRGLNTQLQDDYAMKRSRTSSNSSLNNSAMNGFTMSAHNSVTSSYSSSRDLLQKRKRNHNTSTFSNSPSSRSQSPDLSAKKLREESHEISQSTPVRSGNSEQFGQFNETHSSKSSTVNSSFDGSGGARRKKVLLVCSGRADHYPLPPPPLAGYSITSKDFDSEKKAFLQRLNKALEDTADPLSVSSAPSPKATSTSSTLFSLPTTSVTSELQTSIANSNPLLQSLAKMQSKEGSAAPAQTMNAETFHLNDKVPTFTLSSLNERVGPREINPLKPPYQPAATAETQRSTPLQPAEATQPKSDSPKNILQILTKPLETDSSGFKPIFPSNVSANPPTISSSGLPATSISATNTFKPIFGEQTSQQVQAASTFKPIFGDSTAQKPVSSASPFTFQMNSTSTASTPSFSGFSATTTNTTPSTDSTTKPALTLPTSSSTTTSFSSSLFSMGGTSNSVSAPGSVNSFLESNTTADSQTKSPFMFGQKPTSQATPSLQVFGNAQTAPTSTSQPQQSTMFGSTTSAFTAALGSNSPSFPANSGTSTFNSSSGIGVQADKPTPSLLTSLGASGGQVVFGASTQPTFGSSSQPAFGTNTQPAFGTNTQPAFGTNTQPAFGTNTQPAFGTNTQPAFGTNTTFSFGNTHASVKVTPFGSMNSTQTNSAPTTNMFDSKPFPFGETTNTAVSFGATPSTAPAHTLSFGNSSVTQNNIGNTNPCTVLNFGTPGPTENKLPFVPATPTFGQSPSTGSVAFGTSTPTFASPAPSFGQGSGSFSIGVMSKPSGARPRVMARRPHPRKK